MKPWAAAAVAARSSAAEASRETTAQPRSGSPRRVARRPLVVGERHDGARPDLGERVGAHQESLRVADDHDVHIGRRAVERRSVADDRRSRGRRAARAARGGARRSGRDEDADHARLAEPAPHDVARDRDGEVAADHHRVEPDDLAARVQQRARRSCPGPGWTSERMYGPGVRASRDRERRRARSPRPR